MAIIKWEPWGEMDRFFDDFSNMQLPKVSWDLAVNIYEKNGNVIANMSVPGVDPSKIDIAVVDNDILQVSGSREEEREESGKEFYRKEIKSGSFSRSVKLPKLVDRSKVEANYKDGILEVIMPIAKEQRGSSVKVKVKK